MSPKLYTPTADETDAAVAALATRQPGEAARYARAAAIVLAGAISHDEHTGWQVASQDRKSAGKLYRVTPTTCACWDQQHSGMACKHLDAMRIFGRVLASKLNALMPEAPEAVYRRVLDTGATEAQAAACADLQVTDPIIGDDSIFIVPATQANQRHLFDRPTGDEICTAQQQPSGCWRPATAGDTVAWAVWLGSRQGGATQPVAVTVTPVAPEAGQTATPAPAAPPIDYAARAKLAARQQRQAAAWESSPYKADQRNGAKYGHAPVMQLTHEANQRRNAAHQA